jgi:hypothetical protein
MNSIDAARAGDDCFAIGGIGGVGRNGFIGGVLGAAGFVCGGVAVVWCTDVVGTMVGGLTGLPVDVGIGIPPIDFG